MIFGLADTGKFVVGVGIEGNFRIELGPAAGLTAKKEEELRSKCRDWGRTEGREGSVAVALVAAVVGIRDGPR